MNASLGWFAEKTPALVIVGKLNPDYPPAFRAAEGAYSFPSVSAADAMLAFDDDVRTVTLTTPSRPVQIL